MDHENSGAFVRHGVFDRQEALQVGIAIPVIDVFARDRRRATPTAADQPTPTRPSRPRRPKSASGALPDQKSRQTRKNTAHGSLAEIATRPCFLRIVFTRPDLHRPFPAATGLVTLPSDCRQHLVKLHAIFHIYGSAQFSNWQNCGPCRLMRFPSMSYGLQAEPIIEDFDATK
jgi:hypothetical protein